ncbi:MAG: DUF4143 domain-containing protein [Myxococcaceae bacterium]|nr:DUF4143 domain-containing protein [Myxococcaceae bacterium]
MYERLLTAELAEGTKSVLLLGPRQVGKSTLLKSLRPQRTLDLSSPAIFRDYVREPERLEYELLALPPGRQTVLINEVQRIPGLLNGVQALLDEHRGRFRFLLSGSSARKLRHGQANLLPGRINAFRLHPLVAHELGSDFSLERVFAHGSLPGIYAEPSAAQRSKDLRSYVDIYLREEIQAEALVRNVGAYARLLDWVAAASGRIVNVQKLGSDAGIAFETARRYMEVLVDTLVAFQVPAFKRSDKARLVAHPKTFLFDLGVRNVLLQRPLENALPDERGLLFEHVIAYELWRRIDAFWNTAKLSHYRTHDGVEVDFVLEIGQELWAIEVKASRDVDKSNLNPLLHFEERFPKSRRLVVYLGARPQKIGTVEVLPFEKFVSLLPLKA